MKTLTHLLSLTFAASLAVAGCSSEPIQTSSEEEAVTQICTPGEETCDFGCFFQHGPSTDDCMIKCNATGTAWKTLIDCGFAQNFPFSSSCLDTEPHPLCQNN
jgi:hypothetical protein